MVCPSANVRSDSAVGIAGFDAVALSVGRSAKLFACYLDYIHTFGLDGCVAGNIFLWSSDIGDEVMMASAMIN